MYRGLMPAFFLMAAVPIGTAACANWRVGPGEHSGGPSEGRGQPQGPVIQPEAPPSAFAKGERIWTVEDVYVLIVCASANNPSQRWSEPNWVKKGLAKIADEVVAVRYREGFRRFYVDSPFGKETDEKGQPQFGFFGALRVGTESPWRRSFVDSWRRVTRLSGIKVMAYLGNPYSDKEFKRLAEGSAEDKVRAAQMMRDAVAPIVDAGFQGIGIDASYDTPEDSVLGQMMKEWQEKGIEVFTEGTPTKRQPWLTRFGTIRTVWLARGAPKFHELIDPAQCRGERIQIFEGTAPWPEADNKRFDEWAGKWIKQVLDTGERPAFDPISLGRDLRRITGLEPARNNR